jgi:hypothetical protein
VRAAQSFRCQFFDHAAVRILQVVECEGLPQTEKAGVHGSPPSGSSKPVSISSGIKPAYVIGPNGLLGLHLLRSGLSRSQADFHHLRTPTASVRVPEK